MQNYLSKPAPPSSVAPRALAAVAGFAEAAALVLVLVLGYEKDMSKLWQAEVVSYGFLGPSVFDSLCVALLQVGQTLSLHTLLFILFILVLSYASLTVLTSCTFHHYHRRASI